MNDIVIKRTKDVHHLTNLQEVFSTMNKYRMKLHLEKCVVGVSAGKYLGFMLIERDIKANPEKIEAIEMMSSPKSLHKVLILIGKVKP